MSSFVDSLKFHADTLALRSRRGSVLATNIANAATPHFKARDVNFAAEMQKIAKTSVMTTTHDKHIPIAGAREGELAYRQSVNPSLDGNTVEMNVEQMELSENVIRYQTTLTFLNNKISGLRSAIKGE